MAVASVASAGHSRSQKIVQRARLSAASSSARAAVRRPRLADRVGQSRFGHIVPSFRAQHGNSA